MRQASGEISMKGNMRRKLSSWLIGAAGMAARLNGRSKATSSANQIGGAHGASQCAETGVVAKKSA